MPHAFGLALATLTFTGAFAMKMNVGSRKFPAKPKTAPKAAPKTAPKEACDPDDVSFARITAKTCTINWDLRDRTKFQKENTKLGCWKLLQYNTDKFFSSTVYRNAVDGRCVLAFSGYHGSLAGYIRAAVSLIWPPKVSTTCGYPMWEPYVRLFRHHTSLANWSKITDVLGSPTSPCVGDISFTAESMGGSSGEILAACANAGKLQELMPKGAHPGPGFHIQTLYTFGAPAASTVPITNSLREDGCFKGKRIYMQGDWIAHFGSTFRLQHPRMDAVEIWPSKNAKKSGPNPSIASYRCNSQEAVWDRKNKKPGPINASFPFNGKTDPWQHEVFSYERDMEWLHNNSLDKILDADPYASQAGLTAKMYASLFGQSRL